MATGFFWYELMTTDVAAAEKFYPAVIGWTTQEFPNPDMRYVVVNAGNTGVGGLMTLPAGAAAMGVQPAWAGYIKAANVDAQTEGVRKAGGTVHRPPEDIPGVGRFSVVADPQGAMFMLLQPNGPDQPPPPPMTPGHVGWHEWMGDDLGSGVDFYMSQFGWTKGEGVDMGEMGIYQLVLLDGAPVAGMMTRPPHVPVCNWGFYFNVDGIDAAAKRVTDNGGQIVMGPMEVPGGQWVVNCMDPQGAHFGLLSNTK